MNSNSTIEVFRYRVIYPGGTYVRVSPHVDSEKTGEVLEFGRIFESTKSIFLDGVNYIKLTPSLAGDTEGWVFEAKGGVEILKLVDVSRKVIYSNSPEVFSSPSLNELNISNEASLSPSNQTEMPVKYSKRIGFDNLGNSNSNLRASKEKQLRLARNESKYWRDVRSLSMSCNNFDGFTKLVIDLEEKSLSAGSSDSAWNPLTHREQQIRGLITLLAAVASQCVEGISDCNGLESALWVLVHLGSRVSNIIEFAVDTANQRYEKLDKDTQKNLLHIALEVGGRTKALGNDLSKLVDILPDDLRNFLQRWMFIRVIVSKQQRVEAPVAEIPIPKDEEDDIINASPTSFRRTPATVEPPPKRGSLLWSMLPSSLPSCEGNIVFQPSAKQEGINIKEQEQGAPVQETSRLQRYMTDVRQRINSIINDPNMQLANLI